MDFFTTLNLSSPLAIASSASPPNAALDISRSSQPSPFWQDSNREPSGAIAPRLPTFTELSPVSRSGLGQAPFYLFNRNFNPFEDSRGESGGRSLRFGGRLRRFPGLSLPMPATAPAAQWVGSADPDPLTNPLQQNGASQFLATQSRSLGSPTAASGNLLYRLQAFTGHAQTGIAPSPIGPIGPSPIGPIGPSPIGPIGPDPIGPIGPDPISPDVTIVDMEPQPTNPGDPVNPPDPVNPGDPTNPALPPDLAIAPSGTVTKFTPGFTEAEIAALGGPSITVGTRTIYIGTQQASSINQNPIIASFDSSNPSANWVRNDYETTGADGRGSGLFWDGDDLYGVFSVDGTQGTASEDFRRATGDATQNWLRSYGQGGGPKVAVLGRIDLATGALLDAAYLSAILSNGNSNTLVVNGLSVNAAGNLVVSAQSFFAPRRPNGQAMTQTVPGSSPFDYTVEITPDLATVVSTAATGWQ